MNIEKTMKNLAKNNMEPYFVQTKKEAYIQVEKLLEKGSSVSHGGSETLKETGIIDLLKNGDYNYIDRSKAKDDEELRQLYLDAIGADNYLTSSNAVTENGELYNVDGNSNRTAAILYGPRQVIVVVGKNKIVENINDAVKRVKECAAPPNTKRLNKDTYCAKFSKCVSLNNENSMICDGCDSPDRICCNFVISAKQRHINRIKVIIVNENLGY